MTCSSLDGYVFILSLSTFDDHRSLVEVNADKIIHVFLLRWTLENEKLSVNFRLLMLITNYNQKAQQNRHLRVRKNLCFHSFLTTNLFSFLQNELESM